MGEQVPNHQRYFRQVIFDKNNQVTMIQSARRSAPGCTTFQIEEKSSAFKLQCHFYSLETNEPLSLIDIKDLLIRHGEEYFQDYKQMCFDTELHILYKDFRAVVSYHFIGEVDRIVNGHDIALRLSLIAAPVRAYLLGHNKPNAYYNLMPSGYGWDGKVTNIELVRASKVKQLLIGEYMWKGFDEEFVNKICNKALFTTSSLITTSWHKARPINDDQDIHLGKLNPDSEIFIIGQNEEMSELLNPPISYDADGQKVFKPLDTYNRYITIVTNVLISKTGHPNYGVKIKLYERITNANPTTSHCG